MLCKVLFCMFFIILATGYGQVGKVLFSGARSVPKMLNYQGYLTDTLGSPIDDSLDMTFKIFDAATVGNELWSETQTDVPVERGVFSVLLGSSTPIPDTVFTEGTARWLELTLEGPQTLSPRTRITAMGYAYTSIYSDTAEYAKNAAADNDWARGTPDSVLFTTSCVGLARGGADNMLYGDSVHTHTNFGVACTTGAVGSDNKSCTVAGGYDNIASGYGATVGGGVSNTASGTVATVAGGFYNTASGITATVASGQLNAASGWSATVGGGASNAASGDRATVGGGYQNTASGDDATVGGGRQNNCDSAYATVAGGYQNEASGYGATVGGGRSDTVNAVYGGVAAGYSNLAGDAPIDSAVFVGGGYDNSATAKYATVGGGRNNTGDSAFATVGGGKNNTASDWYATVCGGEGNTASGALAIVGGGAFNNASNYYTTVGGGYTNTASYDYTTVGGGSYNDASGVGATVGGGSSNTAGNWCATVGGGSYNDASNYYATVGGGYQNTASNDGAIIGGGYYNTASGMRATVGGGYGNIASGLNATVPGGNADTVAASYGFATNYSSKVQSDHNNSAAFTGSHTIGASQVRAALFSTGTAIFTMDHPSEPMNKILNQYAVGASEALLMYNGTAFIDEDGRVAVNLPDYFHQINRNPRIQLTGVGTSDVYVAEDISENRFTIGGEPGTKVYWTVTAERKDMHAEIARILTPVEQPKTGDLIGHSLDDDALMSTYDILQKEGDGAKFKFRTEDGRRVYEESKRVIEERGKERTGNEELRKRIDKLERQ